MEIFLLTGLQIGVIASILIEFIKLLPFLNENDKQKKRFIAFIVCFVLVGIYAAFDKNIWGLREMSGTLFATLASAFVLYKTIIQGLEITIKQEFVRIQEKIANNRIAQAK